MPVDQWLCSVTSQMGFLIYLERYFQALLHTSLGEPSIVSIVRTRIQVPPLAR